ncbi:hypothetical protein BH11PSE9_BH11PSE9_29100 [soil metagenome]
MALIAEHPDLAGFAAITGTPSEIRSRLNGSADERVIALTFAHGSAREVQAIADTMASIAPFISDLIARRQRGALEAVVEALAPHVPPPEHLMIEARMAAEARRAVLEGGDWFTAAQVASLAGFAASNPSTQPNKWKKQGAIFAIRHQGTDYFPGYGLDPTAGYRPLDAMATVLEVFGTTKDAWGIAAWFSSVNSFLGGQRPQDLLATQPDRVIAAAHDEMAEIAHG